MLTFKFSEYSALLKSNKSDLARGGFCAHREAWGRGAQGLTYWSRALAALRVCDC